MYPLYIPLDPCIMHDIQEGLELFLLVPNDLVSKVRALDDVHARRMH